MSDTSANLDIVELRFARSVEDRRGRDLEVMAIQLASQEQLVIHAMPMRNKYRKRYEEIGK